MTSFGKLIGIISTTLAIVVVIGGFTVRVVKDQTIQAQTLESVSDTQTKLVTRIEEHSKLMDGRVSDLEKWTIRKEAYDAAVAEMERRNQDGEQ